MSTARETYSPLRNFCIDIGAIRARIGKVFDSTIFYTVSYTYTFFSGNSLALSGVCVLPNATQNQVAVRSCWFESGQGHQLKPRRARAGCEIKSPSLADEFNKPVFQQPHDMSASDVSGAVSVQVIEFADLDPWQFSHRQGLPALLETPENLREHVG